MGGNVFDATRRYSAKEYHLVSEKVLSLVSKFSKRSVVIPAYRNKESFGDIDVLIIPNLQLSTDFLDKVFESSGQVIHNGSVWSLVYEQIQVDLIVTNEQEFDFSLGYFSYNDRGNLIGRISSKFGLTFGHNGLIMKVRSQDHILGEIVLTKDFNRALEFLDIENNEDFETIDDVFQNVIKSKYFNPSIYNLDNRNAVSRIRDRKRKTYSEFLKYVADFDEQAYYQFNKDKSSYFDFIFNAFPEAKEEFEKIWERKRINDAAALMFNGDIVKQLTGLEHKQLGELMKLLKKSLVPDVVVTMKQESINKFIIDSYENSGIINECKNIR